MQATIFNAEETETSINGSGCGIVNVKTFCQEHQESAQTFQANIEFVNIRWRI